ncbi:YodC family protein [Rahnella sp. NRRL B-41462]|uniref:YodC family protein n=1 Tax=Rahnella sp. NRRL B-41462 TaxID=1610579 RepID=UPI000DD2BD24|nr:DUF2158 domain-containing protein [Rahnella sp. NRRL B-41462]
MFSVGDVVMLKSGSPLMTVAGVKAADSEFWLFMGMGYNDGDVVAEWFDGKNLKRGEFRKEMLKAADDAPGTSSTHSRSA